MKQIIAYSDGGSRNNPGNAAYGYVIYDSNRNILYEKSEYIGIATNNIAEYTGIYECIKKAIDIKFDKLILRSDSQLIINQINGIYKIKDIELSKIFIKIKNITFGTNLIFEYVPREQNKYADMLVNKAIDTINGS